MLAAALTDSNDNPTYIYLSIDHGATWINPASLPQLNWQAVAMSSSGQYMVAAPYCDADGNGVFAYLSSDYGSTWSVTYGNVQAVWGAAAFSGNGQYLVVAPQYDYNGNPTLTISLSTDFGVDWI